ncbi:MAG: hypothetical protein J1G05_05990 [Clostridiales bacterium]|nr:hypothetical protein [Clostridiales bacterium]
MKGKSKKVKILLKFYFNADPLNDWLDRLITYNACKTEGGDFVRVTDLIEDKQRLCNLMSYLESRFEMLTAEDRAALKKYSALRVSIKKLEDVERREIKRAVMKFDRKLTYIDRHKEEVAALSKYRAILNCPPNMS